MRCAASFGVRGVACGAAAMGGAAEPCGFRSPLALRRLLDAADRGFAARASDEVRACSGIAVGAVKLVALLLHKALQVPATICDIDWTASACEAFGKHNTCPPDCTAVHAAGLAVLPEAAGMPIADLQPPKIILTNAALRKQWFIAALAAAGGIENASIKHVREEFCKLAEAAGRKDLSYDGGKGYAAVASRMQEMKKKRAAAELAASRPQKLQRSAAHAAVELPAPLQFAAGVASAAATRGRRK